MLPFFLILITSLAKPMPFPEVPSSEVLQAPLTQARSTQEPGDLLALSDASLLRGCAAASGGLASHWALPCGAELIAGSRRGPSFAWFGGLTAGSPAAQRANRVSGTQGGFLHVDLLPKSHFGAGPEVSWVTPDRPHEDLLRQRQVKPGVGVWYSPLPSLLFVGLSANTQVSTLGETWFVNALSSEARCGLSL
jgi:hypothetical protein